MAEAHEYEFDPQLLDLHLGHLSDVARAELQQRLDGDSRLSADNEALAGVFHALRSDPDQPIPTDLVSRSVARVRAAGPPRRLVRPPDELTAHVERHNQGIIRLGNLREIVAVAAMIVLAVGVGVPGMLHMRERQQRLGCSWNLAQLGRGLQQYANAFNASLPFVGWSGNDSWQPTRQPDVVTIPNRRHVYPLLRMRYVRDPRLFVCPSQRHVPMPKDEIERHDDFLEGRNFSYAYQNMCGCRPSANDDPRLPILADENPLFEDGVFVPGTLRLTGKDPTRANSRAHRGAGQNILTLGGNVKWSKTPLCGIDDDNIWILRGVETYTGREGPTCSSDSHLLK